MPARPYDEAYDERGEPREHYAEVLGSREDPGELAARLKARLREDGVTFGAAPDGILALDPVPNVLTAAEWSELQADGFSRVALERGSMVVNSAAGGGVKDVWVPA